jgi:general secretion pathway protein D
MASGPSGQKYDDLYLAGVEHAKDIEAETMNWSMILGVTLALTGCAGDSAFRWGDKLLSSAATEEGLVMLEREVAEHPQDAQYRTALLRARSLWLEGGLARAQTQIKAGNLNLAESIYQDLMKRFPEDSRLVAALSEVRVRLADELELRQASQAMDKGEWEIARAKVRTVLTRAPGHLQAQALLKQAEEKIGITRGYGVLQLAPAFRKPITVEFQDAPLRMVFDALAHQSGLNFLFDKEVRLDARTSAFARDTPLADTLDVILAGNQLMKKTLNDKALLIYPNQPNKVKEYQDQVIRSFFLAHADARQSMELIRTLGRIKDVYVDEKLNAVVVRDNPEAVRLAERLVRMIDRPDAEVMLDVEVMEVKRSRLQALGVQWPTQLTALNLGTQTTTTVGTGVSVTTGAQVSNQMTLDTLRHIGNSNVGVNAAAINLKKDASDVNILANPRIRVKSREKAKVHIGDRVPVITSNTTSTGVVSESVNYLDVGMKLDVEPRIGLDGDVTIKIGLEVSNIVKEVKSATGTLTYQLGSRNANTVLRLKDGETQILAGLISDEDRQGASKVPGLGDLPLLGRLFSTHHDELNKTEIVLTLTPRVLSNVVRPDLAEAELYAGTENQAGDQPLRIRQDVSTVPQIPTVPTQAPMHPMPLRPPPFPVTPPNP